MFGRVEAPNLINASLQRGGHVPGKQGKPFPISNGFSFAPFDICIEEVMHLFKGSLPIGSMKTI
jgi:hypothetical protein